MSEKEMERRMEFAREEAINLWNADTIKERVPMSPEFIEALAKALVVHMYDPHLGCATTGELLKEIEARVDVNYKTLEEV